MTYVILALAVYRLTRLVVTDAFPPIEKAREWILTRWPTDDTDFDDTAVTQTATGWETVGGAEVFYTDGMYRPTKPSRWSELITCPWCASPYISAVIVVLWLLLPPWFEYVLMVPALSAVAGILSSLID